MHEKTETLSQPVVEQLPQATKRKVDNVFKQSVDPIVGSIGFGPAAVPADDETFLHYFDSFMNTSQSDEIGICIPDGRSLLFSHSNSVGFHERNTSVSTPTLGLLALSNDASVSFSSMPSPNNLAVTDDPLQSISTATLNPTFCSPYQHAATTELLPLNDIGRNSPLVKPVDLEAIPHQSRCSNGDLRGNKIGSRAVSKELSPVPNSSSENRMDLKAPTAPSTRGRDLWLSHTRPGSDLRELVDRLSDCDLGEKTNIEGILTMSSRSSPSGHSRSKSSTASSEGFPHETLLMARIRSGPSDDDDIASFINDDLSIDTQNEKGETALHLAVRLGKLSATKALIKRGANVKKRDKRGRGVLEAAERVQRREKENVGLYARIAACMGRAIDAGAVAPSVTIHHDSAPLRDVARSKYCDGSYFT